MGIEMNWDWVDAAVGTSFGFVIGVGGTVLFISHKCAACAAELKLILRIRPETIDEKGAKKWQAPFSL
jgi:hypothetical protein